jgi:hypothetical protein
MNQLNVCTLKYFGQTGLIEANIQDIEANKQKPKYAQHILDTGGTHIRHS